MEDVDTSASTASSVQGPVFVPAQRATRGRPIVPPFGWMVVLASAVGFVVCGRTVFAGLAGTLFVFALAVALVVSAAVRRRGESLLWLGSACALSVGLSFRASPWIITLNMLAICVLLLLGVLCARDGSLFRCNSAAVEEALERVVGAWFVSPLLLGSGATWLARQARLRVGDDRAVGSRGRLGSAIRSLLLAIPVLAVVVPLLRAGDAAFAGVLGSIADVLIWAGAVFSLDVSTTLHGTLGLWVGLTLLALAGAQRCVQPARPGKVVPPTAHQFGGPAQAVGHRAMFVREVIGALWIVNATLAVFAAGQIATAVGLGARLQRDVLSYREIAKDGFFPLLTASAFVLGALLVAHLMLGTNRWERRCVVGTQTMIGLNLLVVAVASRRLWVGADVWGLTMLRVCSQSAALLLGVMLITIAGWQRRPVDRQPIVGASVLGAVVILLLLNVLPVEQYIVNWNAARPAPDYAASFQRSTTDPLDPAIGNDLGVARCSDYFDKWHGRNADAMPAFAPLIAQQLRAGRVSRDCQQMMLHCDSRFGVGGLRWNYARAHANRRQAVWCSAP
jgi:Domain of unknown function (DUF4173)